MTCKHDVKRVTIDPSLLADDKDMIEDLVAAAFNDAVRKAAETSEAKMSKLTAGLPLVSHCRFDGQNLGTRRANPSVAPSAGRRCEIRLAYGLSPLAT